MLKHISEDHEDEENYVKFEVTMTNKIKRPSSRIIDEGLRINNRDKKTLLNSKSEHYGPSIQRKTFKKIKCNKCSVMLNNDEAFKNHVNNNHNTKKSTIQGVNMNPLIMIN